MADPANTSGSRPLQQPEHWSLEALSEERITQLVGELTPSEEIRAGRTMGLHVIDGNDPHSDIGRFVEWTVFQEFFNNDLDTLRAEYEPYDSASIFLIVLDYERQKPAAVLRVIKPIGPSGLKSLNDLVDPNKPWHCEGDTATGRLHEIGDDDGQHTVDIATIAAMPEYRSGHAETGVSAALYSSCVRWSLENGYNYWLTIIDEQPLEMIQAWGKPFIGFEGTGPEKYLSSPASRPMHLELLPGLERIRELDVGIYDLYTRGIGLEAFLLPDFVLPQVN